MGMLKCRFFLFFSVRILVLTEHMLLNSLSYMGGHEAGRFPIYWLPVFSFSPGIVSIVQKQLNISLNPGEQESVVAVMEATPFMENYTGCDRSQI